MQVLNLLCNAFFIHDVGLEAQHGEHHQRGQDWGEEIDEGDKHGVEVAVVVYFVVTGEGYDPSEPQAQSKEDLSGCFPPNLWLQHLLHLTYPGIVSWLLGAI